MFGNKQVGGSNHEYHMTPSWGFPTGCRDMSFKGGGSPHIGWGNVPVVALVMVYGVSRSVGRQRNNFIG